VNALIVRSMALVGSRRDYEAAIADADRVLAVDPGAVRAQVARTVSLLALDRAEEAGDGIQVVENYYAADELNLAQAALYCAARASFENEKQEVERAGEIILECLERYPKSPDVVNWAIKFYDAQERFDRSLAVIRQGMEGNPEMPDYRISLVRRLEESGQLDEATALLRAATESRDPSTAAAALFDLAGFLVAHEEFDQGLQAYEEALSLGAGSSADHLFGYADALIMGGRYDRALEVADTMEFQPHRELVRGRVFFEQADYAPALEHFSLGLAQWPDNSVARYLAAQSADRLGLFDRAIEEYRYAIRIAPGATDARRDLARLYRAQGDLGPAINVLRAGQGSAPPDLASALLEVELLIQLTHGAFVVPEPLAPFRGLPVFEREILKRTLERVREQGGGAEAAAALMDGVTEWDWGDPENAPLIRDWVADLVALGRTPEASERIAAALVARPDAANFHALRGLLLEQTGASAEEVQSAFARANELDPGQPDALRGRARHSATSGRMDEAVEFYLKSAEAQPQSTEALWAALEVLRASGQSDPMRSVLGQILERDPYNGSAAFELARFYAADGESQEALPLARRAMRFESSPEAEALLESLSEPPREDSAGPPN
ncbi:MAG: tetratricopeptide repeat protein, partial [Myxococcota bacterium]